MTKTPVEFTKTLDMVDRLAVSLGVTARAEGGTYAVDSTAAMASGNGERIKSALSELSKALKLSADGGAETKEQLTTVVDNLSTLMAPLRRTRPRSANSVRRFAFSPRCSPMRISAAEPRASSSMRF